MKKTLLVALSLVLAMFALSFVQPSVAYGQEKDVKPPKADKYKQSKSVAVSGEKKEAGSKSGTSDSNIKQEYAENDPDTPMTVPSSKGGGGSKGAGGNCKIMLDNWTNYAVNIYINGVYKGILYGGNESTLYYTPGSVTIYAKAPFSDGSYYYWGPTSYTCGSNQYIYYKMEY